jgi:quinone-modifying oxidoreductase subunit QmoC
MAGTERKVLTPDLDFVRRVIASGGDTVKQCMQCANCSVACTLSPEDRPFPRKEMLLAQWGQKEDLFVDPDIWLCFGCTDCSIQCPRGARPGDVLAAVRKETIARFSPLGFVQKALSTPAWLPVLVLVPVVIWGAFWALFGGKEGNESYFEGIFPPGILEPVLGAMTFLGMLLFAVGALRYWSALTCHHPAPAGASLVKAITGVVGDVLSHARFRQCEAGKVRAWGHILTFFGFALIFVGGSIVGAGAMFLDWSLPLPWTSPLKILLNIGAAGLVAGSAIMVWYRLSRPARQTTGSYYDWFFLAALFGTGVTGVLTQLLRTIDVREVAFAGYFVHLVFVFCLLGYAPWSKIAHLVYRTVALVHARYTGRLRA